MKTMMYKIQLLITLLFFVKYIDSHCNSLVDWSFRQSGLVPDILDKPPCMGMYVRYRNKTVFFGNKFTPEEIFNQPDYVTWRVWSDTYYLLIMIDPDVPSRANPIYREVAHWIVGNIKGSDLSTGEEYFAYLPGLPNNNTGYHRYTFLVYQQPGYINYNLNSIYANQTAGRLNFSVKNFTTEHGMHEPVAGNYLNAAYDKFVSVKNANHTYY